MRLLFTIIIILFWFNNVLGQYIEDLSLKRYPSYEADSCVRSKVDTLDYKTQILDLEIFGDTVYIYKIDIIRDLRCLLINCPIEHYEAIEYRELYLVRDETLIFKQKEYPKFREKLIRIRAKW